MSNNNTFKKVGIASFIMMASVFASRFIGIFREMTIGGMGGIEAQVDAYQIAFVIPEILNHVAASGFLSITFIPIFTYYLSRDQTIKGYAVFSNIINCFGMILLCLILVCMIWTPQLIRIIAPGIENPTTFSMAVKMTRIIMPAQFFFFCGGLFMAVQFANEKFLIPAFAPLIYNLSIIFGGLFLGPIIGMEGFAWGALIGAFLGNFLCQFWGANKAGLRYCLIFDVTHPDFLKYLKLTLPLMLGLTMTFSTEVLFKFFGSFLLPGSIAAMNYALRIMFIPVGLFGQAIGVASYPYLAKLAEKNQYSELNRLLNTTLKFIFLVLPISTLFMALSPEIVMILFQRGAFDAAATAFTAGILPFFMVGAFAFSAQNIVSRGFYAARNTLFPAIFTSLCVIITLPFIYFPMKIWGAKGVALGLSFAVMVQSFTLFECWNQRKKNPEKKDVYLFFLKIIPVSLIIGAILYSSVFGLRRIGSEGTFCQAWITCFIAGFEFLILFFLSGRLLNIQEIQILFNNIFGRIFPWIKKSNASQ